MGLYDPFNVLSILRYPAKQKFYIPFKNTDFFYLFCRVGDREGLFWLSFLYNKPPQNLVM